MRGALPVAAAALLACNAPDEAVDVRAFGALCDGATDDTVAIQTALSASPGKRVLIPGSTVISSASGAPLVMASGTWLEVARDAVVTFAPGSDGTMLQNAAVHPLRTVTDAAITAGSRTLRSSSAAFTRSDVGRAVVVSRAGGADGAVLVANITAVEDPGTASLSKAALASVDGSQCSIHERDSNIRVTGGTWARGAAAGAGGVAPHTLAFLHVDGLGIADVRVTSSAGKYGIVVGDAVNVLAERLEFETASDGIHTLGPATNVTIRGVVGTTGDDAVAFTGLDYPAYAVVAGDIAEVLVEDVSASALVAALVKLSAAGGTKLENVTLRNIFGRAGAGVAAIDEPTAAPSSPGTQLDHLEIDGVVAAVSSVDLRLAVAKGGTAIVRNLAISPQVSHGTALLMGSWDSLSVDGVSGRLPRADFTLATWTSGGAVGSLSIANVGPLEVDNFRLVETASSTSVSNLTVSNVDVRCLDETTSNLVLVRGPLSRFQLWNVSMENGRSLISVVRTSILGEGELLNAVVRGSAMLGRFSSSVDLTMTDVADEGSAAAAVYIDNEAAVTMRGSGFSSAGARPALRRVSGTARIIHPDFPVDLALLAKHPGDTAFNTNAALACGVGTAVSDGVRWWSRGSHRSCLGPQ